MVLLTIHAKECSDSCGIVEAPRGYCERVSSFVISMSVIDKRKMFV